MTIRANWYQLDLGSLPRGIVVAESTHGSAALWAGPITSLLEELAEQLPPGSHPDVVFLGDRRPHSLAAVLGSVSPTHPAASREAAPSVDRQLGRYPVVGPVMWEVERGSARPVLLLLTGTPLDLDDWATPAVARRTLVYRLTGPERVTPAVFTELGPEADLGRLGAHLRDAVTTVRVGGGAAVVVDWADDAGRWADGATTCGPPAAGPFHFLVAHAEGVVPDAVVGRASGAESRLQLVPARPPDPPAAVALSPAEGTILTMWASGRAFWCGACRQNHPPGALWCPPNEGRPGLFPTLAAGPAAPTYVAATRGGRWDATPVPRGIVVLPDGRVVVRRDGAAPVCDFDGTRWNFGGDDPGRFVPAGDARFALRP